MFPHATMASPQPAPWPAALWEHHTLSDDKLLGSIFIRLTGISDAPIPSGFESEVVRGGFVVGRLTGEFQVS